MNRFINSSQIHLNKFIKQAAVSVSQGALVLDAGAGSCPYEEYFPHVKYESADFCKAGIDYGDITHVCDLTSIPVEDKRFDLVICTQVLAHMREPEAVLLELNRVLTPGACLWLSAPLFFEENCSPYDFFRFTQYGLKYLLEKTGFVIEKFEWLEGYYGTLSYQLYTASHALPRRPCHYGGGIRGVFAGSLAAVLRPVFGVLSHLFSSLDLRTKYVRSGHCKNYAIVARKKL